MKHKHKRDDKHDMGNKENHDHSANPLLLWIKDIFVPHDHGQQEAAKGRR